MSKSRQQIDLKKILKENEDLKSRLSEAEETLNSIRNGEVDAIVVSGKNGDKIFSLSSAETPYRIFIEEMDEGAVTINSKGIIIYCNPQFGRIVSAPPEHIVGSDFSGYIAKIDRPKFKELLKACLKKRSKNIFRAVINEKQCYLQLSCVTLPSDMRGDIGIIVSDITELRNYQDHLEQIVSEQTAELNQHVRYLKELIATKDKFFSIVSHDLKNPFTSIMGFADLLVQRENLTRDEAKKYAEIIRNSSQIAVDLIKNLTEWARFQTNKVVYNPGEIDLESVINPELKIAESTALQKSIQFSRSIPSGIKIYADANMIRLSLRNLLSNAIKYSFPGGKIHISAMKKVNEVMVSVSDFGTGIKKENIDKLFKIEENVTTPGTNKEQGTGLGLILVKEFISLHGGQIHVESEFGKCSTFSFTLPVRN